MPISFNYRPSLVAYLTCGDPDLATTRAVALAAISAGAEVIELGVPFSDPVADGPVIQRASERALRGGTTLQGVLQVARDIRAQSDAALIIFSYLNPVLRMGMARFCAAAQDSGVHGALITDLPVEEAGEYRRCMLRRDLATVFLAAPTSTDGRLRAIADACSGFVYVVSRTGVTGIRQELPQDARELVGRMRHFTELPIAVGFGISTPAQFAAVGEFAEAAVVGSAIVQVIEQSSPADAPARVGEWVKQLTAVSRQLSAKQS